MPMIEFDYPADHPTATAYLKDNLGLKSEIVRLVDHIFATVNMAFHATSLATGCEKKLFCQYSVGFETGYATEGPAGYKTSIPLEFILRIIYLSCLIAKGMELLFGPPERCSDLPTKVWSRYSELIEKAVGRFYEGTGKLFGPFRALDDTEPIAAIISATNAYVEQLTDAPKWTFSTIQMLSIGTVVFLYGHERCHIVGGHIRVQKQFQKLRLTDPSKYARVRLGAELEADVMAFYLLELAVKMLIVGENLSSAGIERLFSNNSFTHRHLLGMISFVIYSIRRFSIHSHNIDFASHLFLRNYFLCNAQYDSRERKVFRVDAIQSDEEWREGYLLSSRALQDFALDQIRSFPSSFDDNSAIPAFCLLNTDALEWSTVPSIRESWELFDESIQWLTEAHKQPLE